MLVSLGRAEKKETGGSGWGRVVEKSTRRQHWASVYESFEESRKSFEPNHKCLLVSRAKKAFMDSRTNQTLLIKRCQDIHLCVSRNATKLPKICHNNRPGLLGRKENVAFSTQAGWGKTRYGWTWVCFISFAFLRATTNIGVSLSALSCFTDDHWMLESVKVSVHQLISGDF